MLGGGEILVILVIVLILFGGKRLPEFAQSLGKGIREFKKACNGEEETHPSSGASSNIKQETEEKVAKLSLDQTEKNSDESG